MHRSAFARLANTAVRFCTGSVPTLSTPSSYNVTATTSAQSLTSSLPTSYLEELQVFIKNYDIEQSGCISPKEMISMLWMSAHKIITMRQAHAILELVTGKPTTTASIDLFQVYCARNKLHTVQQFLDHVVTFAAAQNQDVQDARVIFEQLHSELLKSFEKDHSVTPFPKEVIIVAGPPACGKSTVLQIIQEERGFAEPEINVAQLMKQQGVKENDDRHITTLLCRELMLAKYSQGVILLNFPMNDVQAKLLLMLKTWIQDLTRNYVPSEGEVVTNKVFQVLLLHVDAETSIKRQVLQSKVVNEIDNTALCLTEEVARERYRMFRQHIHPAIMSLRDSLYYHVVDCTEPLANVRRILQSELRYRVSLEMSTQTSAVVGTIPLASSIALHARQNLIFRLDRYARDHKGLFRRVIQLIKEEMMHIIEQQAITGHAFVRSVNPVLFEDGATAILLDVMAERGYVVTLDREKVVMLSSVDKETGRIEETHSTIFHFEINIPRKKIYH